MHRKIFVLTILIGINLYPVLSAFHYPRVKRDESVSDNYFGTIVKDPYRWLEDPDSNETKRFVSDQNAITKEYLEKNKFKQQINQEFKGLLNYPNYGIPVKGGSKYYYSANIGSQNQDIVYSIDSLNSSKANVFLDPNQLNSDGTTSIIFTVFSPNGKYCAYGISQGGSDWRTIKVRNTQTFEDLPETLNKIKFHSVSWTHDNLGFFYPQYDTYRGKTVGSESEIPRNEKLFYHRINSNQSEDIKIAEFPENPDLKIGTPRVSDDGKYVHIFPWKTAGPSTWSFARIDSPIEKSLNFTSVTNREANFNYVTSDNNLVYIHTNLHGPNFRIVRVDLNNADQSNWVNIVSEDKIGVITQVVAINRNNLILVYMRDNKQTMQIHNLVDGKFIMKVNTPQGSIELFPIDSVNPASFTRYNSEFFYKVTSYLTPGIIYKYDFTASNKIEKFKESKVAGLNINDFVYKTVFYPSKDGTVHVPMDIIHRKNITLNGHIPTLLHSYGGFGLSMNPIYIDNELGIFFAKNLNGVYAVPGIRGGGEYGERWHEAGMKTNKQNVFDDFASAAEYLMANNYTRRDRLTIYGVSNGGLLVGATANKRPNLFGCALASVGVMDMLRYTLFTSGINWIGEYGDPQKNETEFKYIYRYSPLHSIPGNTTQYPAMLVLTADHDNRVVPAHSFKFTAQLQHILGERLSNTPLMLRTDTNTGHGNGKPLFKKIDEYTDMVRFVLNSLGIDYQTQTANHAMLN